jgi:hypothetical protein
MVNLTIAYVLIAVVLGSYGATLYMRTRTVEKRIRLLEEKD